jgi:glycosyltransferase involved in cell wall biosynthesis
MPLISIVVPILNEEKFISNFLESIINFEIPESCKTEILLYDGMSTDKTLEIIQQYINKNANIFVFDNPGKIQSCAMNLGIKQARGEYIMRLDAHSLYPKDYLFLIYNTAIRTQSENTGGIWITLPYNNSYKASIIQALTTHRFGIGNSSFRNYGKEGKTDTVPYGFYRKDLFEKIGYFDERLVRAQDYELNRRIIKMGGTIWLNPKIKIHYYNQPDFLKFMKKQILREAPYNAYMWYLAPYTFALRHAITALFALGVIGGAILSVIFLPIAFLYSGVMALYFTIAFVSTIQQSLRYKKFLHIFVLPAYFFLYHFLHGIGVLWGLLKIISGSSPVQKIKYPWIGAKNFRALNKNYSL